MTIRRKLEYKLFKGVSIQLSDGSDITAADSIAQIASAKNVWPVLSYPLPNSNVSWKGSDKNFAPIMLNKRRSANGNGAFSPHVMTQVDRLHSEGVTGKGIKIAVVDSGIDYTVSDLKIVE